MICAIPFLMPYTIIDILLNKRVVFCTYWILLKKNLFLYLTMVEKQKTKHYKLYNISKEHSITMIFFLTALSLILECCYNRFKI